VTLSRNLALQGGGAHGAYTWGALDRLLDEEDIEFDSITATSAGAMNAAMLVTGLAEGGRAGAKAKLSEFWNRITESAAGPRSPFAMFALPPDPAILNAFYTMSPAYMAGEWMTRTFSPYQLNPLNLNPLRDLLASACLPSLFQAVEIDGEAYWDGGYMGNPAIYPLIYGAKCRDVLIVHINPIIRDEIPTTAREIDNRVNELSFNASLMREMRAVDFVQRLLDDGIIPEGRWKRLRVHSVRDDETMRRFGVATKSTPDWTVLAKLKDAGTASMEAWLAEHKGNIGKRDSVDIRADFL